MGVKAIIGIIFLSLAFTGYASLSALQQARSQFMRHQTHLAEMVGIGR